MKRILALITVLLCALAADAATPKGEIIFVTESGGAANPVFDVNGTTRLGAGFWGQLYVGLDANNLQKVGVATEFNTGGANLGYLVGNPSTVGWNATESGTTMPVGDQAGVYVLRAWSGVSGSTFETASVTVGQKFGSSSPLSVSAFGGVKSNGDPSSSFPFANQHASFTLSTVAVPEPATLALGLFSAAGLLFRRRK